MRTLMAITGVIGTAVGCGLLQFADLGIDPFNALIVGLNNVTPLSYGVVFMIVTGIMLLVTFILDKSYIGVSTLLNLFIFGFVVEYSLAFFLILSPNPSIGVRSISLIIGLLMISFFVSFYFTAGLGVSAYDALSKIATDKSQLPFRLLRITSDLSCVVIGYLLGASIGIATIVTALLLGPAIEYFNKRVSEPLLNSRKNRIIVS